MFLVSDNTPNPFGDANPFGPMFGVFGQAMSQGPLHWDSAQQFAQAVVGPATGNIDPGVRIAFERLAELADMHVRDVTGLELTNDGRAVTFLPVSANQWTQQTLAAYRPFFEHLATSFAVKKPVDPDEYVDPTDAMTTQLMQMMNPLLVGMAAGSLVGHLAKRSFGAYDLPLPRPDSHEIPILSEHIDAFANDWSLDIEQLRLWVCAHELTSHAVLRIPHVRMLLTELLSDYARNFQPENDLPNLIDEDAFSSGGDPMQQLQSIFEHPERLLKASSTPAQEQLLPQLDALLAVLVGYIDWAVDQTATRLIGQGNPVTEAVRRRRIEPNSSDPFLSNLLGLRIGRAQVDRGKAFIAGVLERDETALALLWSKPEHIPTPAEIEAPGLWLARIQLDELH
jgi:putative hydrolase